jgi:phosphatidylserine/phosphatidylglycerophosphate/cardiolipin synthase-like enzyme
MQMLVSTEFWKEIRAWADKARHKKAAVAYVTRDLIGLCKGDVLVTDASNRAISYGETSAKLLNKLCEKGVLLYHCGDLHAKVLLLGDVVAISSGNMSSSSADGLVEVAVLTDNSATVSGVKSFIEQLVRQSESLTKTRIAALCKIKVIRRSGR